MKEQLIAFETAKLAKLKGFNWYEEHMQTYFSHEMWDKYLYPNSDVGDFQYSELYKKTKDIGFALKEKYPVPLYEPYYLCPTQALLLKWLRDVKRLHVEVRPGKSKDDTVSWHAQVFTLTRFNMTFQSFEYVTMFAFGDEYEEALEKGLVMALNLLNDVEDGSIKLQ